MKKLIRDKQKTTLGLLRDIVQEYEKSAPDPEMRQFYLDEVIYPILEGLKSIKAYGLRATIRDDVFNSSVFFKVNN